MKSRKHIHVASYAAVLTLGFFAGFLVFSPRGIAFQNDDSVNFSEFWEAWYTINDEYPFADHAPTDAQKVRGAIAGMVSAYNDPYTQYFTPAENKNFQDDIHGSFSGIGAEMGIKDGLLMIIAPLKGSSAESAGILPGDIVTKIDGKASSDFGGIDDAINAIRGPEGTAVVLEVARAENKTVVTKTISITRKIVQVPSFDSRWVGNTMVLSIYSFDENLIEKITPVIKELASKKNSSLVIDLRGNPGGYLEVAVDLSSMILPAGDVIVRERPGIDGAAESVHRSRGLGTIPSDTKISVVIDRGSASASEILAGALMDHKRAKIVGETSFGKGSVQKLIDLSSGAGLKVTVAKWFTPNNKSISEIGIKPDISIIDKTPGDSSDTVLLKAISLVQS